MNKMQEIEWLNTPATPADLEVGRDYLVLVDYDAFQQWEVGRYEANYADHVECGVGRGKFAVKDLIEIGKLAEGK